MGLICQRGMQASERGGQRREGSRMKVRIIERSKRKHSQSIIMGIALTLLLAGCGAANEDEKAGRDAVVESAEEADETPAAEPAESSGEAAKTPAAGSDEMAESDPAGFTYLEEYQIVDFYGDGKEYALYAPKGGLNEDGLFIYDNHGVKFEAEVYSGDSAEDLQRHLEKKAEQTVEFWQDDLGCLDVSMGEVQEKGDDRYIILKAKDKDSLGTPYQKTLLKYMSVRDGNVGIFWDMDVREYVQDEETALLVNEVARCYDLDLSGFVIEDGTWAEENEQRAADLRDEYEPEEGDAVLEKVEGYQRLGRLTLTLDDEGKVTYPVLAPMGWTTEADEATESATVHGVSVQIGGGYIEGVIDMKEELQEDAEAEAESLSNPKLNYRNIQVSEVMPLQGQEKGAFYTLAYESQNYGSDEYYKCGSVTWVIEVEENYYVIHRIALSSMDYDNNTNSLIKELEKAYGFDLSEWYAE